jgi:hypothetical protein
MFAQVFNYHDGQVQLRLLGLVALLPTLVCLGMLELNRHRSRRVTAILTTCSAIGSAIVLVVAYISSKSVS